MSKRTTPLHENWEFRQTHSTSPFLPVSQFPTNVHLDLLHHNIIPDPFFAKQELDVQWVGEESWTYKATFQTPQGNRSERDVLVFEGLDTYATVRLNGREVLKADNMFLTYRVDVTLLKEEEGGDNELEIEFESAFLVGKRTVDEWSSHHWGCWNGDPSRLAVRKAQYHYGWDWGPMLLTCGPWRPIYLESYTSRIADLFSNVHVPSTLRKAVITATAEIEGPCTAVVFTLTSPDGEKISPTSASVSTFKSGNGALAEAKFEIADPKLWFPHGYGEQPLYRLDAVLGDRVDKVTKTLGVRRARLVQRELERQDGLSFFFEINNVPIFCGGSNWIPADNFIPRISDKRYKEWLELLAAGGHIMVRVWGGGIYEQPIFYETCDNLGILVWQDFAFGCGNYPAQIREFRESVRKEAIDNVKRLRHHPSIVVYAGNNEDYQYMESIPGQLGYDKGDHNPENWLKTGFPARYIYEKILPEVVEEYGCGTVYHRGSPYSPGGGDSHDGTVGDIHQWNVWHGTQEKYQDFDHLSGRFVSEFGMEAFPSIATIDSYLPPDSSERYAQSSTMDFHNKAAGHEGRMALYLVENIRYSFSPLEQYVYSTQLMQAECLSTAYRLWRREWKGPGKEYVAGALVWQANDCWPVTSWSIIDYHLRPKHSYFAIKRELAPYTIGMKRVQVETRLNKHTSAHVGVEQRIQIWIGTFRTATLEGAKVVIKAWDLRGKKLAEQTLRDNVTLEGNRSAEIADIRLPGWSGEPDDERDVVVAAYLTTELGHVLARRVSWAEPLKYLKLQDPKKLVVKVDRDCVNLSAEVPVKGVAVETQSGVVVFEDNLVDLVPGEVVRIVGVGLEKGDMIQTRYLL